jgi:hypothetical protein
MAAATKNRNFFNCPLLLFIIKQQWTIEEISICSNSSHLEWRAGLSDTNFIGTHQGSIPASFKMAAVTTNRNFFNCPFLL